jgi:hypothetical protein
MRRIVLRNAIWTRFSLLPGAVLQGMRQYFRLNVPHLVVSADQQIVRSLRRAQSQHLNNLSGQILGALPRC